MITNDVLCATVDELIGCRIFVKNGPTVNVRDLPITYLYNCCKAFFYLVYCLMILNSVQCYLLVTFREATILCT